MVKEASAFPLPTKNNTNLNSIICSWANLKLPVKWKQDEDFRPLSARIFLIHAHRKLSLLNQFFSTSGPGNISKCYNIPVVNWNISWKLSAFLLIRSGNLMISNAQSEVSFSIKSKWHALCIFDSFSYFNFIRNFVPAQYLVVGGTYKKFQ